MRCRPLASRKRRADKNRQNSGAVYVRKELSAKYAPAAKAGDISMQTSCRVACKDNMWKAGLNAGDLAGKARRWHDADTM